MQNEFTEYCQMVLQYPPLTEAEEKKLINQLSNGDSEARETLILHSLRLVVSIAKTYSHPNIPLMDIVQEGTIGLMQAIDNFEPSRGCRLSTYATHRIKGAINDMLYKGDTIRIPKHLHGQEDMPKVVQSLQQEVTGIDGEVVEFGDLLYDTSEGIEEILIENEQWEEVIDAMYEVCDEQELSVLSRMCGLRGIPKTQREIAREDSLTEGRISQIVNSAVAKIKTLINTGGINK